MSPRRRRWSASAAVLQVSRGQQPQRRHVHQGTGSRAGNGNGKITLLRATICNSTSLPTTPSVSANLKFPSPSPRYGATSTSLIWWRAIPRWAAAITTRLPAIRKPNGAALQRPHRHPAAGAGLRARRRLKLRVLLKPGDMVSAIGPFGDFHIKPTQHEMVYVGGGAGMAPLRAHLSHLLETGRTQRKISYWYGARSRQEIFYEEYFARSPRSHNFTFHLALSSPLAGQLDRAHRPHPRSGARELSAQPSRSHGR